MPCPSARFDYGDSHIFEVKVVGLAPRDDGGYPRLVESQGEAPSQYDTDEDDEWDEGEEQDEED